MSWLNTPAPIIENDLSQIERLTYLTTPPISYRRTIAWITTRYVGCDYTAAKAFRDALLAQYPPSMLATAPTIEASVQSAGGGQYHVVATVKTVTAWAQEV